MNNDKTFPDSDELGTEEYYLVGSDLEVTDAQNLRYEDSQPLFTQRNPKLLNPHPWNSVIYGSDEDVTDLVEMIRVSRWVKPLVVTPTGIVISGHRCRNAVLQLGWKSVPVEIRQLSDETAELEALLLENANRFKTTEQKVREAKAWETIEKAKAKQRQQQAAVITNQKLGRDSLNTLMENFPQASKGTTRDMIASRVGLGSGRTYSKAAKVVIQIDEEASQGYLETAQALRKVLNEQSIDAAHMLLKKSPEERRAIANLIASGEAKSTFQARQMIRQNDYVEFNDPLQAALAGFSVGDWVAVNDQAQSQTYIAKKGQVELLLIVEAQISVKLSDGPDKVKFYPHELTLIAKAAPPCPFCVGDLVFVDIDRHEAASAQEKKWNGCWGKVTQIGERSSVTVEIGQESLRLFPRDLKLIDAPSNELRNVVEKVLWLRSLELDEIEQKILDVLQRQEWYTHRQLDYLDFMEKLYQLVDSYETPNSHNVKASEAMSSF